MNPTIELLKSHRSIRKFTDQPIGTELLHELVRAGQGASTSNHVQACSIVRVTDVAKRERLAELAGGQASVSGCAEFLVFCADMKRPMEAAARAGADVVAGMTEHLLVSSIDAALLAQNVAVAAESVGLGLCYIGGLRNNPQEVSELLELPDQVYPVFGMAVGYPAHQPDVKPRLPVEAILFENRYDDSHTAEQVAAFDQTMHDYYLARSSNNKSSSWSEQLKPLFTVKLRAHMKEFLNKRGFGLR